MDPKKEKKMEQDILALLKKYPTLTAADDVFRHKNYIILTRSGIQKIAAASKIKVTYEMVGFLSDHVCIKATGKKGQLTVETFGSAKQGGKEFITIPGQTKKKFVQHGNTESWYLAEIAEKRSLSRVVLTIENLYEEGIFGEDESDDFVKEDDKSKKPTVPKASPKKEEKPAVPEVPKDEAIKVAAELKEQANTAHNSKDDAFKALEMATTMKELIDAWNLVKSWGFGSHPEVVALKDECKLKLSE